jgi:hypothetical protein
MSHFTPGTYDAEMRKRYSLDAFERVGWTFLQGGLGVITVEMLELPTWAIPLAAGVFASLKVLAARHVGSQYTAATLPANEETPRP